MSFSGKTIQIIVTNILALGLWYFIYQQSSLSQEQMLLYICLQTIGINLLFFQQKIFKIISLPFMIGLWILLLLWFLPLYKDSLDDSTFYLSQQVDYIFLGNPQNIEIKETWEFGEQKIIPTQNNQKLFFVENPSRTIIFNEKIDSPKEENRLVIKFPNNTIYVLYPWSKIIIDNKNNVYTLNKEYGKAVFYQPTNNIQVLITNNNSQEQKTKSDFDLWYMIDNYETIKTKYIIDQAGGSIIMQPIYQRFSKNILNIAYKIWPNIYSRNLNNYGEYKQFLGRKETTKTYKTTTNWRQLIIQQIGKWRQETRILY